MVGYAHSEFDSRTHVPRLVLSIALLVGLATNGAWFQPRAIRERINDESTLAHRQMGYVYGFWGAMLAALADL